jgi:hypothetical protein
LGFECLIKCEDTNFGAQSRKGVKLKKGFCCREMQNLLFIVTRKGIMADFDNYSGLSAKKIQLPKA